jgi:O-antigen ligase
VCFVVLAETLRLRTKRASRDVTFYAYLVEALCWLLVASVLFQEPLVHLKAFGGALSVHVWDIVWLALVGATFTRFLALRRSDFRELKPPVLSFVLYSVLVIVSLTWTAATFHTDGLAASVIRAGHFGLVAYAAVVLPLVLGATAVRRVILVTATAGVIGAAEALYAYRFETKAIHTASGSAQIRVTRVGGPFGNYFADGTPDHSWVQHSAATNLGLWLAITIAVLLAAVVTAPRVTVRARLFAAVAVSCATGTLLALIFTGSREAWLAGVLVIGLLVALWRSHLQRRTRLLAALALLIGGILVITLAAGTRARIVDTFRPGTFSFATGPKARTNAWLDGLRIGFDRFPIGWGIGGVEEHADRFGRATAENVVIQAWMQTGVLGVVLLLGWFWSTFRWATEFLPKHRLDVLALFPAVVVLSVFAEGVFGYSLGDPTIQILVAIGLSAIAALRLTSGSERV